MKWVAQCAKSLERMTIVAFATRNTIPFLIAVIIIVVACRMPPEDFRGTFDDLFESHFLLALGWALFAITFLGARKLFRWQEKRHAEELERVNKLKDIAKQGQMNLLFEEEKKK